MVVFLLDDVPVLNGGSHFKLTLNMCCFIRCEDDCLPSIDWVLNLAKAAVLRHGVRGLVIDPYNELDHQRPSTQ